MSSMLLLPRNNCPANVLVRGYPLTLSINIDNGMNIRKRKPGCAFDRPDSENVVRDMKPANAIRLDDRGVQQDCSKRGRYSQCSPPGVGP